MTKLYSIIVVFVVLLLGTLAAQENASETEYCKYLTEQAAAQADLLRSPSVVVGPTQPDTGTPAQMVFGLSMSLADYRKAALTKKTARTGCDLNTAISEAQMHINFAIAGIEREVMLHRLDLIQRASAKLDSMASDEARLVEVHNLTRPAVYFLQAARERLDVSRTATLAGISSPYVPTLSRVPLRVLLAEKQQTELVNQKALTNLQKADGWDLKVLAGGRRQIGDTTYLSNVSSMGAFGEFQVTYNLARHAANQHLDSSVAPYMAWKADKFDDVAQQAELLKQQINDTIALQRQQLTILLSHGTDIVKSMNSFEGVDTSNAMAFRNQLVADQILLGVDVDDVQFRIDKLESYLRDNF